MRWCPALKAAGADTDRAADPPGRSAHGGLQRVGLRRAVGRRSCRSSTGSTRRSARSCRATPTMPMPARSSAAAAQRLLTSAGKNGALVTDIRLTFDRARAEQLDRPAGDQRPRVAASTASPADPAVAALVERYVAAAAPAAARVVGRLAGAGARDADDDGESPGRAPDRRCPARRDPRSRTAAAPRLALDQRHRRAHRPGPRRRRQRSPTARFSRCSRSPTTSS